MRYFGDVAVSGMVMRFVGHVAISGIMVHYFWEVAISRMVVRDSVIPGTRLAGFCALFEGCALLRGMWLVRRWCCAVFGDVAILGIWLLWGRGYFGDGGALFRKLWLFMDALAGCLSATLEIKARHFEKNAPGR
jgi:hypothetical protein